MDFSKEALDKLTKAYGSPLYIFNEAGFRENYLDLDRAMRSYYERFHIAYSFKTNYTPYICRTAKELGAYAEVVSAMEYFIAKRTGFEDDQIIFNGPVKGEAGAKAMGRGCIVNADSLDEVSYLCTAAKAFPSSVFKIGLRVNLDVGQGFVSRFGIDDIDIPKAFSLAKQAGNLCITGLHCHISRARSLEAWGKRTRKMLELADRFIPEGPEFIDLGSGMLGSMAPEFAAQFSDIPTYEQYAQVTAGLISEHYTGRRGPVIFTEPGTTLINRFVDCIAKVMAIKMIKGRCFAVLDCGVHTLGETSTLKRLPITVIAGGGDRVYCREAAFTGYTCLEQDVMYSGYTGELAIGDYIVFGNVGGYSNVLKPPFINPNCAMAAEKPDGTFQLIKTAETFDDLLKTYLF